MIKIIYIAGDGRSGSTLLDSILSNIEGSISVGECNRFWVRYVENESHCSCSEIMQQCVLWSKVEERLKQQFPDYKAAEFEKKVRAFQYYKIFDKIPSLMLQPEWLDFTKIVKAFYTAIAHLSGSNCIIDSSKSMPWVCLLQHIEGFDVRLIHLERNPVEVANSWKKTIRLPEYTESEVFMPKKGNMLIAKTWLKIKLMGRVLKREGNYIFVRYRTLCENQETELNRIADFVEERIPVNKLQVLPSHSIGGNPMRSELKKLEIKNVVSTNNHLTVFDRLFFNVVRVMAKVFSP